MALVQLNVYGTHKNEGSDADAGENHGERAADGDAGDTAVGAAAMFGGVQVEQRVVHLLHEEIVRQRPVLVTLEHHVEVVVADLQRNEGFLVKRTCTLSGQSFKTQNQKLCRKEHLKRPFTNLVREVVESVCKVHVLVRNDLKGNLDQTVNFFYLFQESIKKNAQSGFCYPHFCRNAFTADFE